MAIPLTGTDVSFAKVSDAGAVTVGALFKPVTVSRNDRVAIVAPSSAVIEMVALPLWLAAGVRVIVRFAPDPPSVIRLFGNNVVLPELACTMRLFAAVSASCTVNAIGPV